MSSCACKMEFFLSLPTVYVVQNKNEPDKLKSALCQIVPHAFGDHSHCESWYGYLCNPETYRHKSLPHGKDLFGKELQEDLYNILSMSLMLKKLHLLLQRKICFQFLLTTLYIHHNKILITIFIHFTNKL